MADQLKISMKRGDESLLDSKITDKGEQGKFDGEDISTAQKLIDLKVPAGEDGSKSTDGLAITVTSADGKTELFSGDYAALQKLEAGGGSEAKDDADAAPPVAEGADQPKPEGPELPPEEGVVVGGEISGSTEDGVEAEAKGPKGPVQTYGNIGPYVSGGYVGEAKGKGEGLRGGDLSLGVAGTLYSKNFPYLDGNLSAGLFYSRLTGSGMTPGNEPVAYRMNRMGLELIARAPRIYPFAGMDNKYARGFHVYPKVGGRFGGVFSKGRTESTHDTTGLTEQECMDQGLTPGECNQPGTTSDTNTAGTPNNFGGAAGGGGSSVSGEIGAGIGYNIPVGLLVLNLGIEYTRSFGLHQPNNGFDGYSNQTNGVNFFLSVPFGLKNKETGKRQPADRRLVDENIVHPINGDHLIVINPALLGSGETFNFKRTLKVGETLTFRVDGDTPWPEGYSLQVKKEDGTTREVNIGGKQDAVYTALADDMPVAEVTILSETNEKVINGKVTVEALDLEHGGVGPFGSRFKAGDKEATSGQEEALTVFEVLDLGVDEDSDEPYNFDYIVKYSDKVGGGEQKFTATGTPNKGMIPIEIPADKIGTEPGEYSVDIDINADGTVDLTADYKVVPDVATVQKKQVLGDAKGRVKFYSDAAQMVVAFDNPTGFKTRVVTATGTPIAGSEKSHTYESGEQTITVFEKNWAKSNALTRKYDTYKIQVQAEGGEWEDADPPIQMKKKGRGKGKAKPKTGGLPTAKPGG